jgi:CRISPR-associated protein Cas5d
MTQPPSKTHCLEIWGEFACYSSPAHKVERWSYPCPSPSAARGIFDAIYVKPAEFRWQVTKIELLNPPAYIALRRNEVSEVASTSNITKWMRGTAEPAPLFADDNSVRQQRQTMALRDVRYRLHARIVPWPGFESQLTAFDAQFVRRAAQGKCWAQPYLGCRECVAFFRLIDDLASQPPPVQLDQDVGYMLYDVFDLSRPGTSDSPPFISLFKASIRGGVLEVPDFDSPEVIKPKRRAG